MSNTKDGMTYTHGFSRGWWVKIWLNKLCIGSITGACKDDAESIAKEICHRWDSQPDLLEACEAMKKVWWMIGNRITLAGTLPAQIEQIGKLAETAIAKAKKD